jgi:urease gamma subunit
VTLTGTGFVSGSTTVQFGSNIVVNTLVVNNPAQMTANISIGFDAVPGARSVSVTNAAPGGGTATLPNALTVENPAPTLSSIAPVIGSRGSTLSVTLTGSNFSSGLSQVSFGADIQVNSTSVTDPTQIVVNITIPMSSTTGARNVVVTHAAPGGGIATLTGAFSVVNPTPTITGISPTGGERGSVLSVTITGSQFISGVTTVSFGADVTVSSVVVRSPAEIQANITVSPTASLGARTVTVTNPAPGGGSASLSSAFTVGNPVPTIVSITPVSAGRGSMLNVTVIGTQFISGVTSLSFGTPDVSISNIVVKSVTELQASVSISATASLGTRSVTVTNASPGGGLAALTNAFTVSSSPATGMVADGVLPDQYLLQEAYPNPFNPSTRIGFGLPEDSRIRLDVHNMLGNVVAELAVGERAKGLYQLQWHAENLPSGVYLIRLHAESLESTKRFVASRKVVLVK